ncbi:hypothetical protein BJX99DRAFT_128743 [Aspergillus californicus]
MNQLLEFDLDSETIYTSKQSYALSLKRGPSDLSRPPSDSAWPDMGDSPDKRELTDHDTPQRIAGNACSSCRNQKRKCDKQLPICSRCSKTKVNCNYNWDLKQQIDVQSSLFNFQLVQIPLNHDQTWLPSTLQALQLSQQTDYSTFDVDRFFTDMVMRILAEYDSSADALLGFYFKGIHPWLPVIHEQTFRARLSQLNTTPQAETALLLVAIFLLLRGGNKAEHDEHHQTYQLCKYLFSVLQIVRSPSLQLVQAGLLLTVYELGSARSQDASLSIATCAKLGYILRLNIDGPGDCHSTWVSAEEGRRAWMGVYILDRLIHQILTTTMGPHVVDELDDGFRPPLDDRIWDNPENITHAALESALTATSPSLTYFAGQVQAIQFLGQVQLLQSATDAEMFFEQADGLDGCLMTFMQCLFEQNPGSWAALCGANSIALMASITLHRTRLDIESKLITQHGYNPPDQRSRLALTSMVNMVREISLKFNALEEDRKIKWVPLPAVLCTGEALRAALWLNQVLDGEGIIDMEPLRRTLTYSGRNWGLAGEYLRDFREQSV